MAKRWYKTVVSVLILVLVVSSLAACAKKETASNDTATTAPTTAPTAAPTPEPTPLAFKDGKFDPPVTLSTWGCYGKEAKFKEGDTFENNIAKTWMKTNLGIDFQYPWTATSDNCSTKIRLALSSNEELPDFVYTGDSLLINDLIDTGSFMDISEVFDKYASDDYKKILENHPDLWDFATKKGVRYGIPITNDPYVNSNILYSRGDWLTKLNLQTPNTIDELEKVMDAYTNQDPDGNGKKDTYGLAIATKNSFVEGWADTSWIFGAYGTIPGYWIKGADGTLQYGSIQPGAKETLAKLRSWFEKGYLDPEFSIKDPTKESELFNAGKIGMISGPYWLPIWPLPDLKKNVPDSSIVGSIIPSGPDGKVGRAGHSALISSILINKNAKHPEAVLVYLNKMMEWADSKAGSDVAQGFVEGFDYTMVDGKAVGSTDYRFDKILPVNDAAKTPEKNLESLAYLATGAAPRDGFDEKNAPYKDAFVPGSIVKQQLAADIRNEFTIAPTPTMVSKMEELRKMEYEVYTKIIYGKEPLTAFDDFVAKWKSSGGDQITKEVNDWYQSLK